MAEVSSVEVGSAELSNDGYSVIEVNIAEIGSAEIGSAEIGSDERGVIEIGSAEIGSDEHGMIEVGSDERGMVEVGIAEVRSYFRMLFSPRVPFFDAPFESLNVLRICHSIMLLMVVCY